MKDSEVAPNCYCCDPNKRNCDNKFIIRRKLEAKEGFRYVYFISSDNFEVGRSKGIKLDGLKANGLKANGLSQRINLSKNFLKVIKVQLLYTNDLQKYLTIRCRNFQKFLWFLKLLKLRIFLLIIPFD